MSRTRIRRRMRMRIEMRKRVGSEYSDPQGFHIDQKLRMKEKKSWILKLE